MTLKPDSVTYLRPPNPRSELRRPTGTRLFTEERRLRVKGEDILPLTVPLHYSNMYFTCPDGVSFVHLTTIIVTVVRTRRLYDYIDVRTRVLGQSGFNSRIQQYTGIPPVKCKDSESQEETLPSITFMGGRSGSTLLSHCRTCTSRIGSHIECHQPVNCPGFAISLNSKEETHTNHLSQLLFSV